MLQFHCQFAFNSEVLSNPLGMPHFHAMRLHPHCGNMHSNTRSTLRPDREMLCCAGNFGGLDPRLTAFLPNSDNGPFGSQVWAFVCLQVTKQQL